MDVPPASELLERIGSLPAAVPLLERIAQESGVYLVGGAVRDLLLRRDPVELDLVVEGDAGALASKLGAVLREHERFGTSTIALDGFSYDIARARRERYPYPGALPEVEPAGLDDDLLRRDFTVNTAAVALGGPQAGRLRTAPLALEDLDAGLLRVLHDRSFIDDPTRMLRLARYAARLGFTVEPHTEELMRAALATGALETVSGSRRGTELRLLAREPDPVAALTAARAFGLDTAIESRFGLEDPGLAERALELLPADGRRDRLVLALSARRVPPARLRRLLDALAFEAADRDVIVRAANDADALAGALDTARRPSEIAAAANGAPPELVAIAGAVGPAEPARHWLTRLRGVQLEIGGEDLLRAGVAQGPAVGEALAAALQAKLDGRTAGRDDELAVALRVARARG